MGGHFSEVSIGVVEESAHGFIGGGLAATAEVFGLQHAAARTMGARHPTALTVERSAFIIVIEIVGSLSLGHQTNSKDHECKKQGYPFHNSGIYSITTFLVTTFPPMTFTK